MPRCADTRAEGDEIRLAAAKYGLGVSWSQNGDRVVDIDLQAVVVDAEGTIIDAVYYNNLKALKALTHSGDETEAGGKISEVIWVSLPRLPEKVKLIVFVVAAHSGGHLRDVKNGLLHLLEERKDNEIARFHMEQSLSNVDVVAMMVKTSGHWDFHILEEPAQDGHHFMDILEPTLGNIIREAIPGAPRRQKVAFAMQKGSVVDLPETSVLGLLSAGLGWDVSPTAGEVDLDVSAVCFSEESRCLGSVFFGNMHEFGLEHSGDNLTGEGDGDDEVITANLQEVPADVQQIIFVVNIYSNGVTFEQVHNAYCRIFDRMGYELARYVLLEATGRRGLIIARLFREATDRWSFQALGQFCRGKTWKDAVPDIVPLARKSAKELQDQGVSTVPVGNFNNAAPGRPEDVTLSSVGTSQWTATGAETTSNPSGPSGQTPKRKSSVCTIS